MDTATLRHLEHIVRTTRTAALGTLREGTPFVSMVAYAPSEDLSAFYILASRLAYHTQDFLRDPRVSLLIMEADPGAGDPQTLARLTVRGSVQSVSPSDAEYDAVRSKYLRRFPDAAFTFELGDFALYRIEPDAARFVAGFAQTYNLTKQDLKKASASV